MRSRRTVAANTRPMRYAGSVRRFAQGTPSIPALYSAIPGLRIVEEVYEDARRFAAFDAAQGLVSAP